MTLKLTINLTNNWLYAILGIIIFLGVGAGVYANNHYPNPGHSSDQLLISINGKEKTLQQAIDNKDFITKAPSIDYKDCKPLREQVWKKKTKGLACPQGYLMVGAEANNWNGDRYVDWFNINCCKLT
tara:strand:+ start:2225 stop:2605 length:381 start_codon:yes stop_codon:yes gene_type:complete